MDWKIELVAIPVTDVDRAKSFYVEQVGFHADHDYQVTDTLRFVQLTPPGSACSVVMGTPVCCRIVQGCGHPDDLINACVVSTWRWAPRTAESPPVRVPARAVRGRGSLPVFVPCVPCGGLTGHKQRPGIVSRPGALCCLCVVTTNHA